MTDAQFNNAMLLVWKKKNSYFKSLAALEKEYERRFGKSPSETDDDNWIDTFHYPGGGQPEFDQIVEQAKIYNRK